MRFTKGRYYFTGVWQQAALSPAGQQKLLQAIAPHPEGLSLPTLAELTELQEDEIEPALQTLKRHDVVREVDGKWHIVVELFRRWVLIQR